MILFILYIIYIYLILLFNMSGPSLILSGPLFILNEVRLLFDYIF